MGRREAQADIECREGGLARLRELNDPEYRTRYGMYLKGAVDWAHVIQGESHEEWYRRWRECLQLKIKD